jgi:short-subunit dehydrogenase
MSQQTAIITGASQGIGAAIASKLATEGYHTILLARHEAKLQAVTSGIQKKGGQASFYTCDVSNARSVEQTLEAIQKKHKHLPLLISGVRKIFSQVKKQHG